MSLPVSNCKACGAKIVFIKTVKGKNMPCEEKETVVMADCFGLTIVLENGVVVRNPAAGLKGRWPHWASCSGASKFKKKEGKK